MKNEANTLKPGDKVTTSGFPGTVVRMLDEAAGYTGRGMVEVRLSRGIAAVPVRDVVKVAQ